MPRCVHDLEPGYCADCRPRSAMPPVTAVSRSGPGPYFPAGHPGYCAGCGEDIETGDEIRADGDGGWERRDCCGMYADEAGAQPLPPVHVPRTVRAFMSQGRPNPAAGLNVADLGPGPGYWEKGDY